MLKIYKTINNQIQEINNFDCGCWVNLIHPTEDEINRVIKAIGVKADFLHAALDDEETSRIEIEENQTMIIIDIPFAEKDNNAIIYYTVPLAIILTGKSIVTVCLKEDTVIDEFIRGEVKSVFTNMKTRFIFQIFFKVATRYLQYLKQIDKISSMVEKQLQRSMKNKELVQLLDLEKSLVYFSTSLKSNEITMEKILRGKIIKLYEDDQDLLEDVIIENKQAIEMSNIYSSILSGTMDAFASIISNNLNIVMKFLTSVTIVLSLPTMVASFYGMNVKNLPLAQSEYGFLFTIGISAVLTVAATIILMRRKMF